MFSSSFLVVCLVIAVVNAGPASFIKKCVSGDSKCHKESSQAAISVLADGIPELGVEKLDPLYYNKMNASTEKLVLMLSDIKIGGLKQCLIKKLVRENSKIYLKALCNLTLNGEYLMDGKLLFLDIKGKGAVSAVLRQALVSVEADLVDQVQKGKKHWNIRGWKYNYELKEKSDLELANLFEGNELLSLAVRQLLKSSANEVIYEVGDPIIKGLVAKIVTVINKFFKQVPVEDLSLD